MWTGKTGKWEKKKDMDDKGNRKSYNYMHYRQVIVKQIQNIQDHKVGHFKTLHSLLCHWHGTKAPEHTLQVFLSLPLFHIHKRTHTHMVLYRVWNSLIQLCCPGLHCENTGCSSTFLLLFGLSAAKNTLQRTAPTAASQSQHSHIAIHCKHTDPAVTCLPAGRCTLSAYDKFKRRHHVLLWKHHVHTSPAIGSECLLGTSSVQWCQTDVYGSGRKTTPK